MGDPLSALWAPDPFPKRGERSKSKRRSVPPLPTWERGLGGEGNPYLTAALLGLVQGLGEFLPISSSAHLILARHAFRLRDERLDSLAYDVALHAGTTAALLAYTWRDWLGLIRACVRPASAEGRLFWLVGVASLPGAVAGYLLDESASTILRAPLLVATTLAGAGAGLYLADRHGARHRILADIRAGDAMVLGLAQAVALAPGVSRSGATLTAGRLLGFEREAAARISFLMALPITVGALLFKSRELNVADIDAPFVLGIVVSGGTGTFAMRLLLRLLARDANSLLPFALYRCALAAAIVGLRWAR